VERVGRVALVEDDLAAPERAPAGDGEDAVHLVGRHVSEELETHARRLLQCRELDIRSVGAAAASAALLRRARDSIPRP
jgi:hypothetical protein